MAIINARFNAKRSSTLESYLPNVRKMFTVSIGNENRTDTNT